MNKSFAIALASLSGAVISVSAQADPVVKKHDPVAVVYSRCELENGLCKARDGLYYVHNGVAREDLYADAVKPNGKGAQISHVADWSKGVEAVHICSADEAAKATATSKDCEGSKGSGDKWRAWVLVRINPYSSKITNITDPTFIVWYDTKSKITHDGVFESFKDKKTIPSGITDEGTLAYWHFKNTHTTGEERISENPDHFELKHGSDESTFEIKKIK